MAQPTLTGARESARVPCFPAQMRCALSWQFFEKPVMGLKRYFWNSSLKKPAGPCLGGQEQNAQPVRAY